MKYNQLINFEPITEVVKFSRTSEKSYQENLVKTFVFSDTFKENLIPLIVRNLDLNYTGEAFGLQIMGNYGTGKSHLMSLVSLIAENEDLINLIQEEIPKEELQKIAGNFKVLRFELGHELSLWEVITYKIEEYLEEIGIAFSFEGDNAYSYFEKIQLLMAEFEEVFPEKGFLIVIDEMLAYLKSRSSSDKLNQDLQVLQALGQACDKSKFKFMFGVQEMIYSSPEFQFAASMLQKVNDRYKDIAITKEDVAFIVKQRLLRKDEYQKQHIKKHLDKFLDLFSDMNNRTQEYIELFPVHPTYFENFERIRIGKSQREVLKTLSNQFEELLDKDVPNDNPGLLTYDRYWQDIQKSQDLMAIPDVRNVRKITETLEDKIDTYFTGVRSSKKDIAKRIANACAIKLLQDDLNKQNGTNTEQLVDDLCLTTQLALSTSDRNLLIDIIDTTAGQIITATSGQYFDKNTDNSEYHIRVEGGVNFDQKIKDYAATMSESNKDDYFFRFLAKILTLEDETYRSGFKIWQHTIEWQSHRTFRNGYIFFGNPNEKSTTHPRQNFYMYFMPIFDEEKKERNYEEDEVYFVFDGLSDEFKEAVSLYGAASALEVRADSAQKSFYQSEIKSLNKKARALFEEQYTRVTKVFYQGKDFPLNGFSLSGLGSSKEIIFSTVAAQILSNWFENETPNYPKFTQLNAPMASGNINKHVKQALFKIANTEKDNRDGEAVLAGLGLWEPGQLNHITSLYARSILKKLKEKGEGKVLNRSDILEYVEKSENIWLSKDYKLEADFEFVVLATLAALGEIEIKLASNTTVNATNLHELQTVIPTDYFSFVHIKLPKGVNYAALKALFMGFLGRDLSKQLKDSTTFTSLNKTVSDWTKRTINVRDKIKRNRAVNGLEILSKKEAMDYDTKLAAFSGFCDRVVSYTTEAKMKNFPFNVDVINRMFETKPIIEKLENQFAEVEALKNQISYLQQCVQYISDPNFKNKIQTAINQFASILSADNRAKTNAYKSELTLLQERYADWYLEQYLQYRISQSDHTLKVALLDSEDKRIADVLSKIDFLSNSKYEKWQRQLAVLEPADTKVNKDLILITPYQDFNPLDFEKSAQFSVRTLKINLKNLLEEWNGIIKETLGDEAMTERFKLLDPKIAQLLKDFQTDKVEISRYNAEQITRAVIDLYRGLEQVELTYEAMKAFFNKPMTKVEAIEAFKDYLDVAAKGNDDNRIRIILK
jgi:hypothetical protein